jgi:hypothetical protein
MRKVHITLIGGQPLPVYHAIKALSPDYIVYIYSHDTVKVLDRIRNEVPTEGEEILMPPTDAVRIRQHAEQLADRFAQDEVTVNISGGLKSWAFWFGTVFHRCANASVVYVDQNNILWNYNRMEYSEVHFVDLPVFFRLHGNPIDGNYTDFREYTSRDDSAVAIIEYMRRFDVQQFNALATVLSKENQHKLRCMSEGCFEVAKYPMSYVKWKKGTADSPECVVTLNICKRNGYTQSRTISSEHIIDLVFNSGWFEYKVARMLSKWDKAKEIFLNCHFPFKPGNDKNEVDIIVNAGTKLLFVECKTQINSTTDIDKFASVKKNYGGIGSKAIFVTDAPMTEMAIKKCDDNHMLHFSIGNLEPVASAEQALVALLDSDLYNINAK